MVPIADETWRKQSEMIAASGAAEYSWTPLNSTLNSASAAVQSDREPEHFAR
jgi:hypothetical protein